MGGGSVGDTLVLWIRRDLGFRFLGGCLVRPPETPVVIGFPCEHHRERRVKQYCPRAVVDCTLGDRRAIKNLNSYSFRLMQYSLRTLMIAMTCVCVACLWLRMGGPRPSFFLVCYLLALSAVYITVRRGK